MVIDNNQVVRESYHIKFADFIIIINEINTSCNFGLKILRLRPAVNSSREEEGVQEKGFKQEVSKPI